MLQNGLGLITWPHPSTITSCPEKSITCKGAHLVGFSTLIQSMKQIEMHQWDALYASWYAHYEATLVVAMASLCPRPMLSSSEGRLLFHVPFTLTFRKPDLMLGSLHNGSGLGSAALIYTVGETNAELKAGISETCKLFVATSNRTRDDRVWLDWYVALWPYISKLAREQRKSAWGQP